MLSEPIACPRCHAADVSASECAACGGISRIACRACGHEGCRDLLCELRSHDRAFRRRLAVMVGTLGAMVAALWTYGAPLKEMKVAQVAAAPSAAMETPPPPWEAPTLSPSPVAVATPAPAPIVLPPIPLTEPSDAPSGLRSPVSGLPPPASSPPPPASLIPGLAERDGPTPHGFWVDDLDESELRSGRIDPSKPVEPPSVSPAQPPWSERLERVMKEALAARYSPTGTTLRTGLSPGGLVHWVFRRMGVPDVPAHVTEQMQTVGERIEPKAYRPQTGDLLFFKIGQHHHVGIYFDKEQNTFLTVVPSKGGVVVADWDHAFFRSRFLFARRLVPPGL